MNDSHSVCKDISWGTQSKAQQNSMGSSETLVRFSGAMGPKLGLLWFWLRYLCYYQSKMLLLSSRVQMKENSM